MGLNGSFKDTPFADLLQFYSVSKQSAVVRIRLGAGERLDGVFYFADGDLVGGSLQGANGRDAVRRALRLRDGAFSVDVGAEVAGAGPREQLRSVVMEEIVRLDEENRAHGRGASPTAATANHSGAVAAGAAWFSPPSEPVTPLAAPEPTPAGAPLHAAAAPGESPKPPAPPTGGSGHRAPPVPPAAPPPRRRIPGPLIALGVGAAVVLGGVSSYALRRGPAARPAVPAPAPVVAKGPRGVTPDSLVLGMVGSFTGSNKERGAAMRVGWEAAVAEVNEAGGVQGRKLRLVVADDGYDPARTLAGMKDVIDGQGAFAIVGNVGTATSAVAIPYAAEKDAVFFGALSGADGLRKSPPDRLVFNFRASLAREADAAVRYLVDVRRVDARRIAILAQEDEFGASGRRGALKRLAAYGVADPDVLLLGYARNTADVRDAVAKLRDHARDVEAVVMVATYKPAATFIRKIRDAGLTPFCTTVSADSTGLAEELVQSGTRYTEGVLLTQVVPVPTSNASALIRYRKALERWAPGERPGSTSLEAWIGAQIFLEAVKRAGAGLDTAKLVTALEGIHDWDLGIGGSIGFGPTDHQGSDMVFGWLLQPDGSWRQTELE